MARPVSAACNWPRCIIGVRLAQLKPDRLVQPKIRKLFPDTAFWTASLKTDSSGHGTVQFAFPDSITTWRATVRGATADTRVGSTVQKTIVRKNVILRPVVPRFFATGDEITISAVVHNYLAHREESACVNGTEGIGSRWRRERTRFSCQAAVK